MRRASEIQDLPLLERAAPTAADPNETLPSASVKGCFVNNSEVGSGLLFGVSVGQSGVPELVEPPRAICGPPEGLGERAAAD